jgi:hypothetical protein
MLTFTSVYFFESGLFNGLRRIQIKKLSRFSTRLGSCVRKSYRTHFHRPLSHPFPIAAPMGRGRSIFRQSRHIITNFCFSKETAAGSEPRIKVCFASVSTAGFVRA